MFVDASALTAVLTEETDARELLARAQKYPVRFTSPLAVWETTVAVARVLGLTCAMRPLRSKTFWS
jgi:ribonuclease VapC